MIPTSGRAFAVLVVAFGVVPVFAAEDGAAGSQASLRPRPDVAAVRIDGTLDIDGSLQEEVWSWDAPHLGDFETLDRRVILKLTYLFQI